MFHFNIKKGLFCAIWPILTLLQAALLIWAASFGFGQSILGAEVEIDYNKTASRNNEKV